MYCSGGIEQNLKMLKEKSVFLLLYVYVRTYFIMKIIFIQQLTAVSSLLFLQKLLLIIDCKLNMTEIGKSLKQFSDRHIHIEIHQFDHCLVHI